MLHEVSYLLGFVGEGGGGGHWRKRLPPIKKATEVLWQIYHNTKKKSSMHNIQVMNQI